MKGLGESFSSSGFQAVRTLLDNAGTWAMYATHADCTLSRGHERMKAMATGVNPLKAPEHSQQCGFINSVFDTTLNVS